MGTTEYVIVIGALAVIGYLAIRQMVWGYKQRATAVMPPEDPTPNTDALMLRVMELFQSVDPEGSSERYSPLPPQLAQEASRAIFDELDSIIEEGYATKVFDPLRVRLLIKTEIDIRQGAMYLRDGDRERFVDFLHDRLRACGVDEEFCVEALGMYASFYDDSGEEAINRVS